jgi:hypothetical protein
MFTGTRVAELPNGFEKVFGKSKNPAVQIPSSTK